MKQFYHYLLDIMAKISVYKSLISDVFPPNNPNVLWIDVSCPHMPVCKIFHNGRWIPIHTDRSKEAELLIKAICELSKKSDNSEELLAISDTLNNITEVLQKIADKECHISGDNNGSSCDCTFEDLDDELIKDLFEDEDNQEEDDNKGEEETPEPEPEESVIEIEYKEYEPSDIESIFDDIEFKGMNVCPNQDTSCTLQFTEEDINSITEQTISNTIDTSVVNVAETTESEISEIIENTLS